MKDLSIPHLIATLRGEPAQEALDLRPPSDGLPEGYRWAETAYEESGFVPLDNKVIPRKWKDDARRIVEVHKEKR